MSISKLFAFLFSVVIFTSAAWGQAKITAPLRTVSSVDIKRYSGKWYEIAKYPNKFQKQCVGNTTANYSLKQDGKLEIVNECLTKNGSVDVAKGEAKIVDTVANTKLKVRFAPSFLSAFGFVWGDYWVIDLGPEYEYSVVGDPKREYLWVLSRKPELSDEVFQNIQRRVEALGFNPGKLEKTPQNVKAVRGAVVGER